MGLMQSEEERREEIKAHVNNVIDKFKNRADLQVDRSMVMFCSTSSSHCLQQHLDKRKQKSYPTADWLKKLAEKLAPFTSDPKLAGLGALAIAVFIDIISAKPSSSDTTKDALRSVFAEEKASEVWDQIDECLKRCIMNIADHYELVNDLKRIEVNLSAALTKLKNSMVRDGHMSSEALKAWVNGAAFHVQLLIHQVRLGGLQSNRQVEGLVSTYLSDLDLLFKKHKSMVERKCSKIFYPTYGESGESQYILGDFKSDTGETHDLSTDQSIREEQYFEAYYKKSYHGQKLEIKEYFEKVTNDLPQLVRQQGHLSIR